MKRILLPLLLIVPTLAHAGVPDHHEIRAKRIIPRAVWANPNKVPCRSSDKDPLLQRAPLHSNPFCSPFTPEIEWILPVIDVTFGSMK